MEIRDNRELMRKAREQKAENTQTCRVCGSQDVHTVMYNAPTMGCIEYYRELQREAEQQLTSLYEQLAGEDI